MATSAKASSGAKGSPGTTKKSTSTAPSKTSQAGKLAKSAKPLRLLLHTYQVGFGDCFLLQFQYKAAGGKVADRNVLIDFGSTARPKVGSPKDLMLRVARDIQKRCNGKLHAVVATHRHKDHISGFSTNKSKTGTGDIIAACEPDVVIQPWTEDPDAKRDAKKARRVHSSLRLSFLSSLDSMNAVSSSILSEIGHMRAGVDLKQLTRLGFLAADNEGEKEPANKSAIDNLNTMAKGRRGNYYINFGSKSGLEDVLPGVKTHVLGPPDLTQDVKGDILDEAHKHDQFWMLRASAGRMPRGGGGAALFPQFRSSSSDQRTPPHTRWFIRRLHSIRATQLFELVRILDDAMNNTSLILLFEVGGKKLLFPGDAQIENWNYALEGAPEKEVKAVRALLEDVSLYKVGHHGSRNATPRKLWETFARRRDRNPKGDLQTVNSTRVDKHGDVKSKSEVPRETLVTALKKGSKYFSTQELTGEDLICKTITINF